MSIVSRIDKAVQERKQAQPSRKYLGASQIGTACKRKAWYAFRWAYRVKHTGRMLRLFQRGHLEEFRFTEYLRMAGYEVRDYSQRLMYHAGSDSYACIDWDDTSSHHWAECDDVSEDRVHIQRATDRGEGPKQWAFVDHGGHYAGNSDGRVRGPDLPEGWGGIEFKTHSEKSFAELERKGVLTAKRQHYTQMQIYMHYNKLPWCLYMAVNKNTDAIYTEVVFYKPELAEQYTELAGSLIHSPTAPQRLSNDPSWFECRFCEYREICHKDELPQKNCRSCAYARAEDGPRWDCALHHSTIPPDFIPKGCDRWDPIK